MNLARQWIGISILMSYGFFHAEAENSSASGNPYATIVDRNIFSLVPIPIVAPPENKPTEPPAKITPNGIMSLFGQLQALFKVASPSKPGQPAQEKSYTLSAGERQDDIEVTKIDEALRTITFNNHGVVQELSLTNATVTTASTPVSAPGALGAPSFVRPPGSAVNHFGNRFNPNGNNLGNPAFGNNPNPSASPNFGGNSSANNPQALSENLSPEAQALMIEKNRIDTQDAVDKGLMPPLPPTMITPPEATGQGGTPLIAPTAPK